MPECEPYYSNATTHSYSWGTLFPNEFWTHFKRCLRTVRLIAVQPLKVKALSIAEFSSRFRFHLRSHPRWRSLRWKAKT